MQDKVISPAKVFFQNRWVRVIAVINVVIIITIIAISIDRANKTAAISFNVAPIDVEITVNGSNNYENSGQVYYFIPGVYEVSISRDGLDTKTFTVNLDPGHNTTVSTFLSHDGGFYFYALRDNFGSFERLAQIASKENNMTFDHDSSAEEFIEDFQRNYYLFTTQLPATYSEYDSDKKLKRYITVRDSYECDVTLCLKAILLEEEDKTMAISLLEGKGFNVKDFEIKYEIY